MRCLESRQDPARRESGGLDLGLRWDWSSWGWEECGINCTSGSSEMDGGIEGRMGLVLIERSHSSLWRGLFGFTRSPLQVQGAFWWSNNDLVLLLCVGTAGGRRPRSQTSEVAGQVGASTHLRIYVEQIEWRPAQAINKVAAHCTLYTTIYSTSARTYRRLRIWVNKRRERQIYIGSGGTSSCDNRQARQRRGLEWFIRVKD